MQFITLLAILNFQEGFFFRFLRTFFLNPTSKLAVAMDHVTLETRVDLICITFLVMIAYEPIGSPSFKFGGF